MKIRKEGENDGKFQGLSASGQAGSGDHNHQNGNAEDADQGGERGQSRGGGERLERL